MMFSEITVEEIEAYNKLSNEELKEIVNEFEKEQKVLFNSLRISTALGLINPHFLSGAIMTYQLLKQKSSLEELIKLYAK